MTACIDRGTQEIGGTCIELESQGKRIVVLPLDMADPEHFPLHPGILVITQSRRVQRGSWCGALVLATPALDPRMVPVGPKEARALG